MQGAENAKRTGVAVQVGGGAHLANFAAAEKSAQRYIAQHIGKEIGVVVGLAKKVLAAARAGEKQGAHW